MYKVSEIPARHLFLGGQHLELIRTAAIAFYHGFVRLGPSTRSPSTRRCHDATYTMFQASDGENTVTVWPV